LAHRVLDALEQSPHIGPDGSLSALFIIRDAVKAWEAESAREVEVLQLAKRLVQEEFGGYNQWHDLSTSEQERRIQYVKFILAFLAADGRLLPEGGTGAAQERLLRNPETIARVQKAQAERDQAVRVEVTPPAVSVPDSGEAGTRAAPAHNPWDFACVRHIAGEPTRDGEWCVTCRPAAYIPDSGPDGTPEKPWPTWQEVPEGVKYRSADGCYCFVNRNGSRFPAGSAGESKFRSSFSDVVMGTLAPFVRVGGMS
ncbi:hypothetical protein, partial [Prescottella equi]